jgi:hypothetical protein
VSCEPAGLAALSHLTNLETLDITALSYRERDADGKWVFVGKEARIVDRLWEMIRARKAGKPLSNDWLVLDALSRNAERARRASELESQAAALAAQIRALEKRIEKLLAEAKRLRTGD